jgi:hypothetical protein
MYFSPRAWWPGAACRVGEAWPGGRSDQFVVAVALTGPTTELRPLGDSTCAHAKGLRSAVEKPGNIGDDSLSTPSGSAQRGRSESRKPTKTGVSSRFSLRADSSKRP